MSKMSLIILQNYKNICTFQCVGFKQFKLHITRYDAFASHSRKPGGSKSDPNTPTKSGLSIRIKNLNLIWLNLV